MNICIIFGGKSTEYEVSLRSAYTVLESIDTKKYTIHKIGISKSGSWYLFNGENSEILENQWHKNTQNKPLCVDFSEKRLVCAGQKIRADVLFPIMHGQYGEDGRIQAVAELLGARLVGVSCASASLCMDKYLCKSVAQREKIPVVPYIVLREGELSGHEDIFERLNTSELFIKPTLGGSSVGISHVRKGEDLNQALICAFKHSDTVLAERAIKGKECEVGVLEVNGKIITTCVGAISYDGDFYDYEVKYHSDGVRYEIPAKIPQKSATLCRNYAKILFKALGCHGMCRVDFFVTDKGRVYFNEVNAIPGFTSASIYPMLLSHEGYGMRTLIDTLIKNAH